jgi:hypothetical protein
MPNLWKKLAIAAMICSAFGFMPGTTEAATAPQAADFSVTIPGQMQTYDFSIGIEDFAIDEKLSPAERRRIERERWERERRRREMERRRYHRPPPPPPHRRHHYPPPRRHWSADISQADNLIQ